MLFLCRWVVVGNELFFIVYEGMYFNIILLVFRNIVNVFVKVG